MGELDKEDHMAGETDEAKGRVKKAAGELTDDKGLKREGKIDQASAATKKALDDATDKIKRMTNPKV